MFRLYDYERERFERPGRSLAPPPRKRKSTRTRGKRDVLNNWYRARVHPVKVAHDGVTIDPAYLESILTWRAKILGDRRAAE